MKLELADMRKTRDPNYVPGDYGCDPLHLSPDNEADRKNMQLAEIKLWRFAMIAVTAPQAK